MTRGLFDDPPPVSHGKPASNPVEKRDTPCTRPFNSVHLCAVGNGEGTISQDGGKTWTCDAHRPAGFYPHERGRR